MKKVFEAIIVWSGCFCIGCSQFPTQYNRIDAGTVRCLDFIYDPPEAAPGDTVLVRAIFAGDSIAAADIAWTVSWDLVVNLYGVNTALDTVALPLEYVDTSFSDSTSCIAFRFVVPSDIMLTSPLIPDNWASMVPEYYRDQIPPELASLTKAQVLGTVDALSAAAAAGTLDFSAMDPGVTAMIPSMLQLCTVMFRMYANPAGLHTIESYYTVRYNSRFADVPGSGVYQNTNPAIDSVGVHIVKKENLQVFDPAATTYETRFVRLFGPDDRVTLGRMTDSIPTITIDAGHTYFIEVFTSNIDSALSIDATFAGGAPLVERHMPQWYFQLDVAEVQDVSAYDFMNIVNLSELIGTVYPSKNDDCVSATVWCEVFDQFINEVYRPQGSTLKEVRLQFTYTDAYLESLKETKIF